MKKKSLTCFPFRGSGKQLWRIMKLTALISFVFVICASAATSYSQTTKLSLKLTNSTIKDVLNQIEARSEFVFLYKTNELNDARIVNVDLEDASITEVLDEVLKGQNLRYDIYDRQVIIREVANPVEERKTNEVSQGQTVTGTVKSTSGDVIPGATVVVKGNTNGTITDVNGSFLLKGVSSGNVLVFSFIGMQTLELPYTGQPSVNVVLQEDMIGLEEVVAVGYGTLKKSDLTGSITQVKAADMVTVSVSNPIQALQGRVAGMAVLSNNSPGSSPTLRIRGSGSINAGNDPLYVVDGFPLMNSNLNDINPNDIASIEVLKDASSSAIYGSRGANGVIIITTKKGEKGRNDFSVSSYVGIQTPERLVEMLGRDEFIKYVNEAYTYSNGKAVYTESSPAPDYDTDWQAAIVKKNALIQEHSITFNGGKDKTEYLLSASMFNQEGLVAASGYKKLTVRNNLTHEFSKWLTVGTHMQMSNATRDIRDNPTGDVFRFGWPTTPIKFPDGSWYYSFLDSQHDSYIEGSFNPVADASEVTNQSTRSRILGDIFAEFSFTPHLKFKTNFGVDLANTHGYEYETSVSSYGLNSGGKGLGGQSYNKMTSLLTENILSYSNVWNNKHRFSATGVYSYQDYTYEGMSISGSGFENDETGAWDMSLADKSSISYSSTKYDNKLISWTARTSYTYDDKYMVTATGRYDGSSRFGANNKWGFFPSFGIGWRVNQESFLKEVKAVSNLKLRASYGVTGNQEISNYASLPQLSSVYYVYDNSLLRGFVESIGNSDLKWERTTQYDLGLDIGLWDRVDITLDYYDRRTTDLLYSVPIPTTSGYSSILDNVGEVSNKGFELSVNARVIDKVFKWDVSANISKNNNEIVELYGDVEQINLGTSSNGFGQFLKVGEPVNGIYTRESAGIIRTEEQLTAYQQIRKAANLGEEMYVDHSANNSIGTEDYICIGSPEPKLFYGFSCNFEYKKFKLGIYGQGAYDYASVAGIDNNAFGSKSISIGYASNTSSYLIYGENQLLNSNYQPSKYAYDRMWSESNPNGEFPRAGAREVYISDRTNGGWNYFIIKNIKLGYDFSSLIRDLNWMKELTVYANAQNYISFANQRGYNPENGDVSYPWAKTIMFGVNAKF